jgi:hypothetical protein
MNTDGGEVLAKPEGLSREAGSETSAEQTREPMDENWIGGLRCRASEQRIAKPTSIESEEAQTAGSDK